MTSLATVHADGSPSLVISCMAHYAGGDIKLKQDESDQYAWVNLEEAKKYKLLDGIYDELVMVENQRKGEKSEWQRFKKDKNKSPAKARLLPDLNVIRESGLSPDCIIANAHTLSIVCL